MARIVYTGGVKSIRGTIGNMVYKLGRGGQTYLQNKSTSVRDPHSQAQGNYRGAMARFSTRWKHFLSVAQQEGWELFGRKAPHYRSTEASGVRVLSKKPKGSTQGLHYYCKCNIQAASVGQTTPIDDAPPVPKSAPNSTGKLAAAWDDVDKKIVVTFPDPNPRNSHSYARVFIKPSGRESQTHKHMAASALSSERRVEITKVNCANGASLPTSYIRGEFIYIQADFVDDVTGLDSGPSNTVKIKCAPSAD